MIKEIKVNEEGLVSLNDVARVLKVDLREWITKKETQRNISQIESNFTGQSKTELLKLFGTRGGIPTNFRCITSVSGRYGGGTYAHELVVLEFMFYANTSIKAAMLSMQFGMLAWESIFASLFYFDNKEELKEVITGLFTQEFTQVGILLELLTQYELKTNTPVEVQKEYVYLYYTEGGTKIGRTTNPKQRFKSISTNCPYNPIKVILIEVTDSVLGESSIHKLFNEKVMKNEWFNLEKRDLELICDIMEKSALWIKTEKYKNFPNILDMEE